MICPKCGFSQPEDVFCAKCGIDVGKYLGKKRLRRRWMCVFFGLFCAGALLIAMYAHEFRAPGPGRGDRGPEKKIRGDRAVPKDSLHPDVKEEGETPTATSPRTASPKVSREPSGPLEESPTRPTAIEWFQKGKALGDDSDEEIRCYLMALALNPQFAPAYYRLGAIYFRRAEYDLADRTFRKFLRLASERDRENYDISVFYSPKEVEELLQKEDAASEQGPVTVVGFKTTGDQVRVPVLLNDSVEAEMQLDTGSEVTVISKALADSLNLTSEGSDYLILQTIGEDVQVPVEKVDSIRLGAVSKRGFSVAVSDLDFGGRRLDGILGMDFFRGYDMLIDKSHQVLVLRPKNTNSGR